LKLSISHERFGQEPDAGEVFIMRSVICPTSLHLHDLASHFLALSATDRFLRFGGAVPDADIVAYVESLLQQTGDVFLVVETAPDISGVLHVEFTNNGADLGLSVSARARGKGIGTLLLERAKLLASARGASTLFVRNLNLNPSLRRLAHRLGIQVLFAPSAQSIRLDVPAPAPSSGACDPSVGTITLVDYSLRSQSSAAAFGRVAADELRESMQA
jgi:GNAT superfamily N-acetyltransferase